MITTQDDAAVASDPTETPANQRCDGCDQPGHEVGPLMPCIAKLKNGVTLKDVRYCAGCLDIANQFPGWLNLNTDILSITPVSAAHGNAPGSTSGAAE